MPEKSSIQRLVMRNVSVTFIASIVLWIVLLIAKSSAVRQAGMGEMHQVAIGPLLLNTITKRTAGEGYTLNITFETGLVWYMVAWLVLGLILAFVAIRFAKQSDTNTTKP